MRMKNKIKMMGVVLMSLGMFLALPLTISLASGPASAPGIDQASSSGEHNFTTLAQGEYCQWDVEDYLVIRDQETLEKIWMVAGLQPPQSDDQTDDTPNEQDIPEIDFTQEMVIAAFMGKRPTSDFSIEIKIIADNTVYVNHCVPLYLTKTLSLLTPTSSISPYHIIKTSILPEPVEFHITTMALHPSITRR